LTAGAYSFGYDFEGQLNSGYGSAYTFDYEHRLKTIGSTIQFSYDGAGNRLKVVRSGIETRYIYDAGGNLLAEADSLNNITKYYIHGLGLMAMVTPANQTYCYHFNAVGSTVAMTDNSQTIVNKYSYDPFGNIVNQVEAVAQPFKFIGQFGVMTEPNGFYYMRARYYDPEVGRFISEDPIGFEGGDVNLMAYVGNQPVNRIDPSGLFGPFGPGLKNIRPTPNPEPPRPDAVSGAAFRVDPNIEQIEQMLSPQRKAIPGELTTIMASELFDVGRQAYTDIANFARYWAHDTLLPIILIPKEFLGPRELQAAPFKP
jgi:RHS repeat-associated protein